MDGFTDFLNELKLKIDITDLVSPYTHLKTTGRISSGLCPFHREKTPSFKVYTDSQTFYCFGCGVGGDIITFVMLAENLEYIDALKYLADKVGLTLPNREFDSENFKLRSRIFEINRLSARFFHEMLYSDDGKSALAYLQSRKLSERAIRHFGLGYAPKGNQLYEFLREKDFSDYELEKANVIHIKSSKPVDRFFDRVIFPIINVRGNVVAFGARAMGDSFPKYLNTADTPVFKKSDNIFALNFAKQSKEKYLILAEGYMDVIAFHKIGFIQAVASLGTALTPQQSRLMSRYAEKVIIAYDSDSAGQKATKRAIPILRNEGLEVEILKIPSGKDPDEFICTDKDAKIKLKKIITNAQGDIEYRINNLKKEFNLTSTTSRVGFVNKVCEILSTLDNEIERDIYISKLSNEESIDRNIIKNRVNWLLRNNKNTYGKKKIFSDIQDIDKKEAVIDPVEKKIKSIEEIIIAYIINNSEYAKDILGVLFDEYEDCMVNKDFFSDISHILEERGTISVSDFSANPEQIRFIARSRANSEMQIKNKEGFEKYKEQLFSEYKRKKIMNNKNSTNDDISAWIEMTRKQKQ